MERHKVEGARRVVVKLGSNLFFKDDGNLALERVARLIRDLADAHLAGRQIIVVSSGAVALGANVLHLKSKGIGIVRKQAFAAVGQSRLMKLYEHEFSKRGLVAAQVLLTSEDFSKPSRFQNVRNTLTALLQMDVIPVINENDTVATEELETRNHNRGFSDNDQLSALVMSRLGADLLVLLSDVDGLYTGNPVHDSSAKLIPEVRHITERIASLAGDKSERGRGGMATKLQAARIAMRAGGMAIIANGTKSRVLQRIFRGEAEGTLFVPES